VGMQGVVSEVRERRLDARRNAGVTQVDASSPNCFAE